MYAVSEDSPKEEIRILPVYSWTGKIKTEKYGEIDVQIRELIHDFERRRAMQLIMRAHYLNPPLRGLFIGCWLTNQEQMMKVRKGEKDRRSDNSSNDAWVESISNEGQMVGCAVLDTLYQGLPNGRKSIVKLKGYKNILDDSDEWVDKKKRNLRSKIVNLLGVAWASRFAVDEPYRNLQLGTLLAKKLVDVAYLHKVPRAKFIEVITTESTQMAKMRLKNPKTSFLGKAGYTLNQDAMSSRSRLVPDENGDQIQPESVRKLYYFKETSSNENRK